MTRRAEALDASGPWGTWSDKANAMWHRIDDKSGSRPLCYHANRVKASPLRRSAKLNLDRHERACPVCVGAAVTAHAATISGVCGTCNHPIAEHYDLGCIHEITPTNGSRYCKCKDAWRDESGVAV